MADALKEPDEDIIDALATIEVSIDFAADLAPEEVEDLRCVETVIRRLAREAGYDINQQLN